MLDINTYPKTVALISDIHANLRPFQNALADAHAHNVDEIWLLGDFVGRGTDPVEVLSEIIKEESSSTTVLSIAGNHDKMLLGEIEATMVIQGTNMNMAGIDEKVVQGLMEQKKQISKYPDQMRWLKLLRSHREPLPHFMLTHGRFVLTRSGRIDPHNAYQIYTFQSIEVLEQAIALSRSKRYRNPHFMAVGHTHIPGLWQTIPAENSVQLIWGGLELGNSTALWDNDHVFNNDLHFDDIDQKPLFLNPGSIGNPRQKGKQPIYALMTIFSPTSVSIRFRTVETT